MKVSEFLNAMNGDLSPKLVFTQASDKVDIRYDGNGTIMGEFTLQNMPFIFYREIKNCEITHFYLYDDYTIYIEIDTRKRALDIALII